MASWSEWQSVAEYKRYQKTIFYADGKWSGVTLSASKWVNLANSSTNSKFIYYHNLGLDVSKIVSISASVWDSQSTSSISTYYGLRCASTSSTGYRYFSAINLHGSVERENHSDRGGVIFYNDYITTHYTDDNYFSQSSSTEACQFHVYVYSNYVKFVFDNIDKNFYQMRGYPVFNFEIIYK